MKMPLAKRRLALFGPTQSGIEAAARAALVVAAEARYQGASEDEARQLLRWMPFRQGTDSSARIRRAIERRLALAYQPTNGQPILTGCCQDPRARTGNQTTSKLRDTFAPFCDQSCANTCGMLKAIRNPGRLLYGTPYEALDSSGLWVHGSKLPKAAHDVWRLLASLAVTQNSQDVRASFTYITMKLDGHYTRRTVIRAIDALTKACLVTLLDKKTGLRRVHPLTAEQVAELERERGVHGARERNIAEARQKATDYLSWLDDPVEAWTLGDDNEEEDGAPATTWSDDPSGLSPLEQHDLARLRCS